MGRESSRGGDGTLSGIAGGRFSVAREFSARFEPIRREAI